MKCAYNKKTDKSTRTGKRRSKFCDDVNNVCKKKVSTIIKNEFNNVKNNVKNMKKDVKSAKNKIIKSKLKKKTIAEIKKECKSKGLVYDPKTKQCRERKKRTSNAKPTSNTKPTSNAKPTSNTKPTTKKTKGNDRRGLCMLPEGYEWDGRLGQTGKDGETWKVVKNGKRYACKIFDAKKSEKLIKKEIDDQKKMSNSGVSPKVVFSGKKCFLMEMVNGYILRDHKFTKYTEKDVKELSNIAHALADKKIGYDDGNVKMNVMYDKTKDKWMIIDFGMVSSDSSMKKLAKQNKLSLHNQYLLKGFDLMLRVEALFMKKLYSSKKFPYTPLGGGFVPKKSFPSLLHEMKKLNLLKHSNMFNLYKSQREMKGKYYDQSNMIGV